MAVAVAAAVPGLEKRGRRRGEMLLLLLPLPPCPDLRRGEGGVTAAMPGLERRERRRGVLLLPLSPDLRRGGEEGEKKLLAAAAVPGVKKRGRKGREGV